MRKLRSALFLSLIVLVVGLGCKVFTDLSASADTPTPTLAPKATPLPPQPVVPGAENPDEPVFISGDIPYTSPFFLNTISAPFVMLEDEAGFVRRDREFQFPLEGQALGPVEIHEDDSLTYSLALPAVPQGTQVDVDNDGSEDAGVQVFAIAYWSNTWGGPFLEKRDGSGWSNAYASTITDPDLDDEIIGGILVVWSPDDQQGFPSGFGSDGLLFTEDDPSSPIPAGYNLIDLDQDPFRVFKQAEPSITLNEGVGAVNDLSSLSYSEAFDALFDKVSREYPFTQEKNLDWEKIRDEISSSVAQAGDETEFYKAMRDFAFSIPDAHVSISFNPDIFYEEHGGGFGLVLTELSDGRLIVSQILSGAPADEAGIPVGAEIVSWGGEPVEEAISDVVSSFGPYSTEHHKRLEQVVFLTRIPPDTNVIIEYKNPNEDELQQVEMQSVVEYDSLFASIPTFAGDEIVPPVQGEVLDESGLGYLKINTFSDDYNLLASTWEHYLNGLLDNEIPALIIDVRTNSGGSGSLALDFAGYFFDREIPLYEGYYYSDETGDFESDGNPARIFPGPFQFEGPVAVLVSPYCVSACEGFVNAITQDGRATVVGHYPTAGAFGEVGRGQYDLPDGISMQFPTGRPESMDGKLLIEGTGVVPDITVPLTEESVLGGSDAVLQAAVDELLDRVGD